MGFHHVALATRDLAATHRFYTDVMGFDLAKVVVAPTPKREGMGPTHAFYDTGGDGMLAFWDLHDETLPDFDPAISTAVGLPEWVNHLAFDAPVGDLDGRRDRWLAHGFDVVGVDHGFCHSIYAVDPNGILVEWCGDTRPLDADDRAHATRVILAESPDLEDPPIPTFYEAAAFVAPA